MTGRIHSISDAAEQPPGTRSRRLDVAGILLLVLVSISITVGAMRRTSTTFDEIVPAAAGLRGFETGEFGLMVDHPPLIAYLYGFPLYLLAPDMPDEGMYEWGPGSRYPYAQVLFFELANDPERLAFAMRLVAAFIATGLVLAVFLFTRRHYGTAEALIAAGLTAFLPDMLAHGGVAYNDVPLALSYFVTLLFIGRAARNPKAGAGAVAGTSAAIALGVKFSAVALLPVAVLLLATEIASRRDRREYLWRAARAAGAGVVAAYITLVLLYRGDPMLDQFRFGLNFNLLHASAGHGNVPAWLMGQLDREGFWYFFPVAFFLKTPAALHVLALVALVGLVGRARRGAEVWTRLRHSALWPLLVGSFVFGAFLVSANLNIGFRHALPMLPPLLILVAIGAVRFHRSRRRLSRAIMPALLVLYVASSLSFYPHFLAYTSEYRRSRDQGWRLLVDSNLDWGQGLLELRRFMREHDVESVYLSYFGSARPAGYGIRYHPLPSFAPLDPPRNAPPEAEWVAISATNLVGNYLQRDHFADFRAVRPTAVLGHSIMLYRIPRQ